MCGTSLSRNDIKVEEILKKMDDQAAAGVLRDILFDSSTKIDWERVGLKALQENMPELKMF